MARMSSKDVAELVRMESRRTFTPRTWDAPLPLQTPALPVSQSQNPDAALTRVMVMGLASGALVVMIQMLPQAVSFVGRLWLEWH